MDNIEIIKKNNELFANSLTFKIIWKRNFYKILLKSGFDKNYIDNYAKVIEKYIKDYEKQLKEKIATL